MTLFITINPPIHPYAHIALWLAGLRQDKYGYIVERIANFCTPSLRFNNTELHPHGKQATKNSFNSNYCTRKKTDLSLSLVKKNKKL